MQMSLTMFITERRADIDCWRFGIDVGEEGLVWLSKNSGLKVMESGWLNDLLMRLISTRLSVYGTS
jgi:hypothetical protein